MGVIEKAQNPMACVATVLSEEEILQKEETQAGFIIMQIRKCVQDVRQFFQKKKLTIGHIKVGVGTVRHLLKETCIYRKRMALIQKNMIGY